MLHKHVIVVPDWWVRSEPLQVLLVPLPAVIAYYPGVLLRVLAHSHIMMLDGRERGSHVNCHLLLVGGSQRGASQPDTGPPEGIASRCLGSLIIGFAAAHR